MVFPLFEDFFDDLEIQNAFKEAMGCMPDEAAEEMLEEFYDQIRLNPMFSEKFQDLML